MSKRLTDDERKQILELKKTGVTNKEIGEKLGRKADTVSRFIKSQQEDREKKPELVINTKEEASQDNTESEEKVPQEKPCVGEMKIGPEAVDKGFIPNASVLDRPIMMGKGVFTPDASTAFILNQINSYTHEDWSQIINKAVNYYGYVKYGLRIAILMTHEGTRTIELTKGFEKEEDKENFDKAVEARALSIVKLINAAKEENKSGLDELFKTMMVAKIQDKAKGENNG